MDNNPVSGFLAFLNSGGPAMWALLVLSILSIGIVLERLFFFSKQHSDPNRLLREIGERVSADDMKGATDICDRERGMLPRILQFGLYRAEKSRADISDALSIALLEQLNLLEANLSIIGTVAVIAPFVGLFGTVLGIIRAFKDIALKGNSTPAVVAAGVSEALVTTAAGLAVAVIAVIFFNYFKSRIKAYNQEMIVTANKLAEMLHFHNTGAPIPTELYTPPSAKRPVTAPAPRPSGPAGGT
ncbi:MAG: MotA/TolQ/ExbB proton channel family protein [Candidatus Eremiobacteraeota bacterium]|nr:MotA/TolQ/ExbB proton channel family protein [Candidatus Eremiobacteraeota bacterium]MBC5827199.1 MotA/TolQ/ExbB proton channel family protein [Candidatus Eremiobacteraeota bacterium]